MELSKGQKNSLFYLLRDARVDPREFTLAKVANQYRLTHHPTGYYFIVEADGDSFWCSFVPDTKKNSGGAEATSTADFWDAVLRLLDKWVSKVRDEYETPDLWDTVQATAAVPNLYALWNLKNHQGGTEPFPPDEQAKNKKALKELKEDLLDNLSLGGEKERVLADQFEYLEIALARVSRYDWKNILGNCLVGLVYRLRLKEPDTRRLFRITALYFGKPLHKGIAA